ncbi:MAG: rhomboid family intramembrane serine protease [Phycisphaerae bacterium]|nr:rhomboid family intramembrane serine protease [Phycisphaerae bacterium]
MFQCPACSAQLEKSSNAMSDGLECEKCGGQAMTGHALSHRIGQDFYKQSRRISRSRSGQKFRKCPSCSAIMDNYAFDRKNANIVLKTCQLCDLVWFEGDRRNDVDSLLNDSQSEAQLPPPPKSHAPMGKIFSTAPVTSTGWKLLPALLGLPIECSTGRLSKPPIVTLSITVMIAALLGLIMGGSDIESLKTAVNNWGLIPAQAMRNMGLTFVSSFFLHGGWGHLLGNAYFLLVFGASIEDSLRWYGLVGLLTAGHMGGLLLEILVTSAWDIPIVGASAGISAILGCYAIVYARSKLGWVVWIPFTWRLIILRVPALVVLTGYAALQAISAIQASEAPGPGVAYAAHLGGLAVGALWGLAVMNKINAKA